MNAPQDKCTKCGATLADGLCRQCLLLVGMETTILPFGAGQARRTAQESLIEHLFPELDGIRLIGRGGMGVVYQAHQRGVNRDIALKLLPSETIDAPDSEERFEIEARAAARLDHPNIITLYEFGERGGSLFLKMKLVENGRNLAHALREQSPWPVKDAVALLIKLARAVHHAHQHGIIHRDIKPGNVLLDPRGEPLLSDFGLARIVEEDTGLTRSQIVLGTASYMAPEQADGKKSAITTAADVYSLGAVLYEMLTGRPPFDGASSVEILRRVIEEDPAPPGKVNESVDGDLSTICLKCLEKSPARRYGSAEALAGDLALWQQGRPISARPISTAGRITKWARRRPAFAALTGALAASMLIGSTLAIWQAVRATRAEKLAKQEAAKALRAEKGARDEAAISKAVNEFMNHDLLGSASPDREPDRDLKVRTVLDRADRRIENRFPDQPLVEAAIRLTLATTYASLGQYEKAQQHARRSVELRQRVLGSEHLDTLRSRHVLAVELLNQGKYAEAETEHRAVLKIRVRVLGPEDCETLISRCCMALSLQAQGKYAEAETEDRVVLEIRKRLLGPEHRDTLAIEVTLATLLSFQRKYAEAEAEHRSVLKVKERVLGPEHRDTLFSRHMLADALMAEGKCAEAETEHRAVLKIRERILGPEHPDTLKSRYILAFALRTERKYAEAETEDRGALEIRERVLGPEHPETLLCRGCLVSILAAQGKHAEAEAESRALLTIRERVLGPEDSQTLMARTGVAHALDAQGKSAEAEMEYRAVLEITERARGTGDSGTLSALSALAVNLKMQGKLDEAREYARQALDGRRKVLGPAHPDTIISEKLFDELTSVQ